jgi:hypothetical protein
VGPTGQRGRGGAAPARGGNEPRGPDGERGAREKVGPETAQPGGGFFLFLFLFIFLLSLFLLNK